MPVPPKYYLDARSPQMAEVYGLRPKRTKMVGKGSRLRSFVRKTAKECMLEEAEMKHDWQTNGLTPVSTAGTSIPLSILSQGTSEAQRIG